MKSTSLHMFYNHKTTLLKSFLILISLLSAAIGSQALFFLDGGRSIYHINSIGSGTLSVFWIFFKNISEFNFFPQLWSHQFITGGFLNLSFSYFNPLFFTSLFFDNFNNALIFYDIQLKFIAGTGLYLLLRKYELLPLTALLCACLFSFNGVIPAIGQDPQYIYGVCLLPWLFLSIERIIAKHDLTGILAFSLLLSLIFLISVVHTFAFLNLFIIAPFLIVRICSRRIPFLPIVLSLLAGVLLHFVLVSFAIVPIVHDLLLNPRGGYIYSNIFTDFFRMALYLSVIAFISFYLLTSKNKILRIFAKIIISASFFICLNKINGDFVGSFLDMYTVKITMKHFRYDQQLIRYLFTGIQGIFILYAIFSIDNADRGQRKKMSLYCTAVAYCVFMTCWDFNLITHDMLKMNRSYFTPLLGIIFIFGAGVDLFLRRFILTQSCPQRRRIILTALLLLVLVSEAVFVYFNRNMFSDALKYTRNTTPETQFLTTLKSSDRIFDVFENEHEWLKLKKPPWQRSSMVRWVIPVYFKASTFSIVGLAIRPKLAEEFHLAAAPLYYGADSKKPVTKLLSMAGVNYIASHVPLSSSDLELVVPGKEYMIYKNKNAWPRVTLFGNVAFLDEEEILPRLAMITQDERFTTAYLSEKDSSNLNLLSTENIAASWTESSDFISSRGSVKIVAYRNEYVEIDCDIQEKSLLVLSDTFYPGWKAYIGNKEHHIFRANYAFRGIVAPIGKYKIVMRYQPAYRMPTLFASGLTALLVIIFLLYRPIIAIRKYVTQIRK
jgi:hypothetical protein